MGLGNVAPAPLISNWAEAVLKTAGWRELAESANQVIKRNLIFMMSFRLASDPRSQPLRLQGIIVTIV